MLFIFVRESGIGDNCEVDLKNKYMVCISYISILQSLID